MNKLAIISGFLGGVKNRYMTIAKNDSLGHFIINLPWIIAYEVKLWLYFLFFKPHLLRTLVRNFGCIKKALKKRR